MNHKPRARFARRCGPVIAAVIGASVLSACSGGADATQRRDDNETTSDADPEREQATEQASSDVTLDVWVMGDSGAPFEELVADFTAETGVAVNVEAIPWDNVNDKLTTSVASGSGPDVTQIGLSMLAQFQEAGALLDLADHVGEHPGLAPERFVDAATELTEGDQMLSVPWVSDTRVLFYRSDVLEEAGFDGPPQTWDELHDMAVELAGRGEGQFGYYIPQWDRPLPVLFTWQAGGDVVAGDEIILDTPELREALEFYTSFHAHGAAPLASDFDQAVGFISGVTPMLVSGPYLAKAISEQAPELDGSWSVALLPENENRTSLFAGSNLGVWHNTEHPAEALALLEYVSRPQVQLRWYETMGELPTVSEALADDSITTDPLADIYVQQLQQSRPLPLHPAWDAVNGELLNAINDVILNGVDLDTALEQLQARVEQTTA